MKAKYSYTIYEAYSDKYFNLQCEALEKNVPGLLLETDLTDVDGTRIRTYYHPKGKITVIDDYLVDALYVDADFDLVPYFN